MSFPRIHLLSRSEPWYAGDSIAADCGTVILKPVAKGQINDWAEDGIGFMGVCPKCVKAKQPAKYLYAIREALDEKGAMVE